MINPELSELSDLAGKLEASLSDMPRIANAPAELAAELAECKEREPALYKKARHGDASAASALVVLNAQLKVLPQEIEEAKDFVSQALGPLLDLAMELQEHLLAASSAFTAGLTDGVANRIEQAVAPSLPPGAKADYLAAARGLASHLPGYETASAISGRLKTILANHPNARANVENWPLGLTTYTHHEAFRLAVATLEAAKEFLRDMQPILSGQLATA